jgi:effector-binding domain-containing protein
MADLGNLEQTEADVPPVLAAQLAGRSASDPAAISAAMGVAFGTIMQFLQRHGLAPVGPPRALYTEYGPQGTAFTVAMPIAAAPDAVAADGPVRVGTLGGGKALRFTHRGPYRDLAKTYERIAQIMQAQGRMKDASDWARYTPMWEEYLNDPRTTPEADLLTHIYLPLT